MGTMLRSLTCLLTVRAMVASVVAPPPTTLLGG